MQPELWVAFIIFFEESFPCVNGQIHALTHAGLDCKSSVLQFNMPGVKSLNVSEEEC